MQFEIRNSEVTQAFVLDENGDLRAPVTMTRTGDAVRFQFPHDALYVVLQDGPVRSPGRVRRRVEQP